MALSATPTARGGPNGRQADKKYVARVQLGGGGSARPTAGVLWPRAK